MNIEMMNSMKNRLPMIPIVALMIGTITFLASIVGGVSIAKSDFEFHSKIITNWNRERETIFYLDAIHSNDQKRSKLTYSDPERVKAKIFSDEKGIIYKAEPGECLELEDSKGLDQWVFNFAWPIDFDHNADWLVGVAKVLHFLEQQGEYLVLANFTDHPRWHNTGAVKYQLTYIQPSSGQETIFDVYYAQLDLAADSNSQPVGLVFNLTSETEILIEISQMRQLSDQQLEGSGTKHDRFILDPNICRLPTRWLNQSRFIHFDQMLSGPIDSLFFKFDVGSLKGSVFLDTKLKLMQVVQRLEETSSLMWELIDFNQNQTFLSGKNGIRCWSFELDAELRDRNFGELLLGSDLFLPLGRARVRGLQVRSSLAEWKTEPYWLKLGADVGNTSFLVYQIDCPDYWCPLVSIEILDYTRYTQTGDLESSVIKEIEIHEFNINPPSALASEDELLFRETCLIETMKDATISIELLLECNQDMKFNWPEINQKELKRQLIHSLQADLLLSPLMIDSLRAIKVGKSSLLIEFNLLTQRTDVQANITLEGQTDMVTLLHSYEFTETRTNSFHICVASSFGKDLSTFYIAYDYSKRICYLPSEHNSTGNIDFEFQPDKPISVFRLESDLSPRGANLTQADERYYLGKMININLVPSELIVRRARIQRSDLKSDELGNFGLIESSETHRYKPESPSVSLSLCRSVCLSQIDCRSYSLCQNEMEFECVISNLNLAQVHIMDQLRYFSKSNRRAGKVKVHFNDTFDLELQQNSRCELHAKRFLDFFTIPETMDFSQVDQSMQVIELNHIQGREQCAEICIQHNLNYLRQDEQLLEQFLSKQIDPSDVSQVLRKYQSDIRSKRTSEMCSSFLFAEWTQTGSTTSGLNQSTWCLFARSMSNMSQEVVSEFPPASAKVWRLSFEPSRLFEQRRGLKLLESKGDSLVVEAYKAINEDKNVEDADQIEALRLFVAGGGNFQLTTGPIDSRLCAQKCFEQSLGPWPSCRSFHIVVDSSAAALETSRVPCILNSITLSEAHRRKTDHNSSESGADVVQESDVLHFEPLGGIYLVSEHKFSWDTNENPRVIAGNSSLAWLPLLLGSVVGLFLGYQLVNLKQTKTEPKLGVDLEETKEQSTGELDVNADDSDCNTDRFAEDQLELMSLNSIATR